MKYLRLPLLAANLLLVAGCAAQAQSVPVSITVHSEPRQTFGGLGASLGNWGLDYQKLQPAERAQMSKLLWGDLHMKTLRLWLNLNEYAPTPTERLTANFRARYIDSGIIADARKNGVVHLLLAPDGAPDFVKTKRDGGGNDFAIRDDKLADYAGLIAEFIGQIQRETGVLIDVTGFQNEPNDLDRIAPEQMAPLVKFLRAALDARGLKMVQIIGPESASADGMFYEALDKLKADPQAWQSLGGIASHSYAMGATPEGRKRIEDAQGQLTKSYWMTEASANGAENEGDTLRAASLASRFLSDMNQGVTHWIHFIGFEVPDPHDNATRILAFQSGPLRITTFQKYWTYQQLSAAFDVGATFRSCTSSLDGDMVWTYGKKPHLNASAARNPDGSWSIGLSNFTSPNFNDNRDDATGPTGDGAENGFKAQSYTVKIALPELERAGRKPFKVMRSQSQGAAKAEGTVEMRDGAIEIPAIGPLELVTLRSQ